MARYQISIYNNNSFSSMNDEDNSRKFTISRKIRSYSVMNRDCVPEAVDELIKRAISSINFNLTEFRKLLEKDNKFPLIDPVFGYNIYIFRQGRSKSRTLRKVISIESQTICSDSIEEYLENTTNTTIQITVWNNFSNRTYKNIMRHCNISRSQLEVLLNYSISKISLTFTYNKDIIPVGESFFPKHMYEVITEQDLFKFVQNKTRSLSLSKESFTRFLNKNDSDRPIDNFTNIMNSAIRENKARYFTNKEGESNESENIKDN